jgi:hypothetical protein
MNGQIEDMLLCVAGHGGRWVSYAEMREWELFGKASETLVPATARRMADIGLAERKRFCAGMGIRLTHKGNMAAEKWQRECDAAWKALGVELLPIEIPDGV